MQSVKARTLALLILGSGLVFVEACRAPIQTFNLASPDGNISLTFELKSLPKPYAPGSRPYYRVSYKGQVVLADSPLGLKFAGAPALDRDLELTGSAT
ncbi:MAG: glycoside hydrolase family 97 N-terminal domain-containing protein, partial [Terriglobia bacterium]